MTIATATIENHQQLLNKYI